MSLFNETNKNILIGAISSVATLIIVGLVTTFFLYQKKDITENITKEMKKETGKILLELEKEQKSRCELAAILMKSGLDLPVNLLTEFSRIEENYEYQKMLLDAIISQTNNRGSELYRLIELSQKSENNIYNIRFAKVDGQKGLVILDKNCANEELIKESHLDISLKFNKNITQKCNVYPQSLIELLTDSEIKKNDIYTVEYTSLTETQ